MRWAARLSTLLLVLAVVFGCAPQPEVDDATGLHATIDAFYAAVESGDTEARLALFGDDAIMMPNHWVLWQGKATIVEAIGDGEGWVFNIRGREIIDMDISEDLAYTVNSYSYTYHAVGDEPQWHKTKNVHIWKKDVSGEWKLHVDIWNSDVPMDAFGNE